MIRILSKAFFLILFTGTLSFAADTTKPSETLDPKEARIKVLEESVAQLVQQMTDLNTRVTAIEAKLAPKPKTTSKKSTSKKPAVYKAPTAPRLDPNAPVGSESNPIQRKRGGNL